jgi:hypothetical protein
MFTPSVGIPSSPYPQSSEIDFTGNIGCKLSVGAIARQIVVEGHGGAIEGDSVIGEATEFVVKLPI